MVRRLRLATLSPAGVAQLAEPHGVDADELFGKTGGNPFFVVEVLASGVSELPDTVRDAVLARAGRLDPAARALLDAVAVVPQQVELWLLEALAPHRGTVSTSAWGRNARAGSTTGLWHEVAV